MKITKELLEHLQVSSINLKIDNNEILCCLERIEKEKWTFTIPESIKINKNKVYSFHITFSDKEASSKLPGKICDYGENWVTAIPDINTKNTRLKLFLSSLSEMAEKYESFGRRKEERVKIGKEYYKIFGLSSIQQNIFLQGIKMLQPCVVLDASVHGICVITPETPAIKDDENFLVKLSFENPQSTVVLKAHKVYTKLNKTEQKNFLTLCCQLLEPIHYEWKERVINMIQKDSLLK